MLYRSISKIFKESCKQIKYLPSIIRTFNNWLSFLLNHLRILRSESIFKFKNGIVIQMDRENDDGWSPGILMDIFIKKEYGVIPDNIILLDIGANIGAFSIYSTYNLNNICYSYEPVQENYDLLIKNIKNNNLETQIKPFKMAVSDHCSEKKLYKSISMSHSLHVQTNSYEIVKTVSLENIFIENNLNKINIAKIDCEGGEYDIIYSSPKDIVRKIENFLIEYHNTPAQKSTGNDLLKYFIDFLGYEILNHKVLTDKLGLIKLHRI